MPQSHGTRNTVVDMAVHETNIAGVWELTPRQHPDSRGLFFEWFTDGELSALTGHRFDLRQANCSVSTAGTLRGLHFAELPPGQAKYVTCVSGAVFDVAVDIRVGSPTFGDWHSSLLDTHSRRSVYLPEGLAHGFLALQDNSTVMYLCSAPYNPQREHTIVATDPALAIDWPIPADEWRLSERDASAPGFDEVRAAGLLPTWDDAQAHAAQLRARR